MNFTDFVKRFDAGEVGEAQIDELLDILYGDDAAAKQERRDRVVVGGQIIKFQAVGLNKQAQAAWREAQKTPLASSPEPLPDLPPEFEADIPDEVYERPDYVPQIKSRVGIVQAVRTWGKNQARIKDNRTEGVKVRCPYSHHTDNRPSAWVNTSKNTWYCGKCEVGGDVIDFYAAAKHDLTPADFHRSPQFARIVEEMADELGIQIVSTPDGGFVVETDTSQWASNQLDVTEKVEDQLPPSSATVIEQTDEGPVTLEMVSAPSLPPSIEASEPITISTEDVLRGLELDDELPDEDEDDFDPDRRLVYEWRDLGIPANTFLYDWMTQAEQEINWVPQEFLLGLGFQAVGAACAHSTTSLAFGLPLTAATLYVLIGDSGGGKSTAVNRLRHLFQNAVGPKWDNALGSGVKIIEGVSSAEALTLRVKTEIIDINDPKAPPTEVPTNAWYVEDELATFISRSRRQGGEHIKQRVMRFHDFTKKEDRPELVVEDMSLSNSYRAVHDSFFTGTFLTQPAVLPDLASRNDLVSGFFNRMCFFMGHPREQRMFHANPIDPNPPYIKTYERMWKDCQLRKRVIPFSDDAAVLVNSHPLNTRMDAWAQQSPMFARWQLTMLRVSLMLAVNENSLLVEVRHVEAAYRFVSEYLIPCAAVMVDASLKPKQDEVGILVGEIESFCNRYFDRHGEWPEARLIKNQRWWKHATPYDQDRARTLAGRNGTVVEIQLIDGPWGPGKTRTVSVVPTGDYSVYDDAHGKKYKYADFYAGRKVR